MPHIHIYEGCPKRLVWDSENGTRIVPSWQKTGCRGCRPRQASLPAGCATCIWAVPRTHAMPVHLDKKMSSTNLYPCASRPVTMTGKVNPTNKLANQLTRVATAMAAGRGPWVNNSEVIIHGIEPGPRAKKTTKERVETTRKMPTPESSAFAGSSSFFHKFSAIVMRMLRVNTQ